MATNLVTKAQIIKGLNLQESQIPEQWIEDAEDEILQRTGVKFFQYSDTLRVDGTSKEWIQLPVDYIQSVTTVTVGDFNGDNPVTVSSTSMQIVKPRAMIYIKRGETIAASVGSQISTTVWTEGVENVIVVGTFGQDTPDSVRHLAKLIVLRYMRSTALSAKLNWDIIRRQTARWTEAYSNKGSKGLDELIEYFYSKVIPIPPHLRYAAV